MNRFKKGDIVGRISYNKDVIFEITDIIKVNNNNIYILKGITERIQADSIKEDLELIDKRIVQDRIRNIENKMTKRIEECLKNQNRTIKNIELGKILHLEGDIRIIYTPLKVAGELGFKRLKIRKNVYHSLNCRKEFICLD